MVSKKSKLIFLMPPKTASNSLSETLYDSSINFDENNSSLPKIHLFLSELAAQHDIHNIEDYKVIQVIRNPISRYISSYQHQMKLTKNVKTKFSGMDINQFTKHLLKSLIHSEDDFLERFYGNTKFISNSVLSGKSWGGSRLYLKQKQWNDLDANIKYFSLEDISVDLSALSDYLGVYLPEMPKKNVNKNKFNQHLNETSLEIIEFIYDEDSEIFNSL